MPELTDQLAAHQPAAIEAIAKERVAEAPLTGTDVPALGYGLAFGVVCREWYPFATGRDRRDAGRRAFPRYPASVQDEAVGSWAYANDDLQPGLACSARLASGAPGTARHHPDPAALGQFRRGGVPRLDKGRSQHPAALDDHQHPGCRALCRPSITVRPNGDRVVPRQSERPGHFLRRRTGAARFHLMASPARRPSGSAL